jgi:hypothetical protein
VRASHNKSSHGLDFPGAENAIVTAVLERDEVDDETNDDHRMKF